MGLAAMVAKGDARAAARLISLAENDAPGAAAEIDVLYAYPSTAMVTGITGAPGTGKSTLVDALVAGYRQQGQTAGVIAIDPTSAVSGGAVLGDRIRMQRHSTDPGVFIRSLGTRGWAGGLARAALSAVRVLDVLGMKNIIVETVGAGQVETDIAAAADTVVVVLNPGSGDAIQTLKAGILETGDIYVINKADLAGADLIQAELEGMLSLHDTPAGSWNPPVIRTVAPEGNGIEELGRAVSRHRDYLRDNGLLPARRRERARLELLGAVAAARDEELRDLKHSAAFEESVTELASGGTTPRRAAHSLLGKGGNTND